MRKLLAVAAIGLASVSFGIGLGRSSSLTAAPDVTDPAQWDGLVRVVDEGAAHDRDCPHRDADETST